MLVSRRPVSLFSSYAHHDVRVASRFLRELAIHLKPSQRHEYTLWRDRDQIVVGEDWELRIRDALGRCDLGLLLLSPAFLGSKIIATVELPPLLGRGVIPVMLRPVDHQFHNLLGLKRLQWFELLGDDGSKRAYSECRGPSRDRFVLELFRQIERRAQGLP